MSLCAAQGMKGQRGGATWKTKAGIQGDLPFTTISRSGPHVLSLLPLEHVSDTSNLSYQSTAQNVLLLI